MRKIENEMLEAIKAGKVWHNANTFVDILPVAGAIGNDPDKYCAEVLLHGNPIARVFIHHQNGFQSAEFDHCGWKSNVTASRIRAIQRSFGLPVLVVKAGKWFIDGKEV